MKITVVHCRNAPSFVLHNARRKAPWTERDEFWTWECMDLGTGVRREYTVRVDDIVSLDTVDTGPLESGDALETAIDQFLYGMHGR